MQRNVIAGAYFFGARKVREKVRNGRSWRNDWSDVCSGALKMTDHQNVQIWNWRTYKWRTNLDKLAGHEVAWQEIDGHRPKINGNENARHVSSGWIYDRFIFSSLRFIIGHSYS